MSIHNYGKISSGRDKKIKRKIKGIIIVLVLILSGAFVIGILTDDGPEYQERYSAIEENHALKEQVAQLQNDIIYLEGRIAELEGQVTEQNEIISSLPTEAPSEETLTDWTQDSPRSE